jgi:Domain of unknown function (DUF4062)
MPQKKKLQVFVSSTYEDLKEERQAAVEAILTAGHIPAGMELFAAGDESQMNAIRRWIDESDVFLLILGGRYGSLEPKSQKSYIHLEYEYAIEKGKPVFAIVIEENHLEEKVKKDGTKAIERENPQKLKEFQSQVLTRLVRFWSEPSDIKLAILETMSEFNRRDDLMGWIPGDEGIKAGTLTEEIARLARENASLREQIVKLRSTSAQVTYSGLTYEEMSNLLLQEPINLPLMKALHASLPAYLLTSPTLLSLFWFLKETLAVGISETHGLINEAKKLVSFGLAEPEGSGLKLNEDGRRFLSRLRFTRYAEDSEEHTKKTDGSPSE